LYIYVIRSNKTSSNEWFANKISIDADKEQLDELWGAFSGGSSTVSVSELTKAIDGCDELYRNIRRANSAKWTDNKASAKAGARETVWDESRFQNAQMTYGQR